MIRKFFSLSLLSLTIALLTASCGDSDSKSGGNFNNSQFVGDWCTVDGNAATRLTISERTFTGEVYTNITTVPSLYETLSGGWSYYSSNDMLQLQILHSATLEQVNTSFKALKVNKYTLQLREQETGAVDEYHKLIETKTIEATESFTINYSDGGNFSAVGYSSSNPSVASVDSKGKVTGVGHGVAFITVDSQDAAVVVKVKVTARVEGYVSELLGTIDAVMNEHGTPDAAGSIGENKAILYKQPSFDAALSNLQYQYDEKTREVTRILSSYKSVAEFNSDANFIRANYIDHGGNMYGTNADFMGNEYLLSPFTDNSGNWVSYNNQKYYLRTGHY